MIIDELKELGINNDLLQVSKKNVSKETSAKIHEKAQPFIKWLKEAEEESESDDDEIEVDFDTRAHVSR